MQPPIFICGSPRSGTTLVSQILNAHPDVTIFDEVNLLDVARLWERLQSEREQTPLAGTTVANSAFYNAAVNAESATDLLSTLLFDAPISSQRWGEKFPAYITVKDELTRLFPGHHMIFVVRDPRAILASMLRYRNSEVRSADDFWIADDPSVAIAALKKSADEYLNVKNEIVTVRYEALVANPASEIRRMCEAVDISFREQMVAPRPGALPGSALTSQFVRNGIPLPWKNSNRSTISGEIVDRWRSELKQSFWDKIDGELRPIMRAFGYEFEPCNSAAER